MRRLNIVTFNHTKQLRMKFKSTKHFFALFAVTILFISFSSQHPAGRTGAPGDGLCTDCHSGGGSGFDGDITMSGVPGDATPGQIYNVTVDVELTAGSPVRGGFQIVALRNADDTQAGVWSNNDGNSSFRNSNSRTYFGHNPAQNFGGGTSLSWEADWEAPSINDDVTFYMVSILGNGGGSGGDNLIMNEFNTSIEVLDPITIEFINVVGTTCNGISDGSAEADVTGGSAPYEYEWDNGDDTAVAMNLSGGSHSVTVTDENGSQMVGVIDIPEPSEIDTDPTISAISCFGEEDGIVDLDASGGTGSLTCNWGGSIGEGCEQDGLAAGIYFVTVSDENLCENVFEIEILEPDELMVNLGSTDVTSLGNDGVATARATGGTAPYEFEWSNGTSTMGNTSQIDGLVPGTYSVVVTDSNGCETMGSVMVNGTSCNINIVPTIIDVNCFGESSGEVLLNITGISTAATFNWSNGATTNSIIGVPAGIYDVTVTENVNCMEILTGLLVSEPDSLQTAVTLLANPACETALNGRINLAIAGGVEGYDLVWSNGFINDTTIVGLDTFINLPDTLTDLGVGTFIYTLTDANGCMVVDSVTLTNSDILPPTIMLEEGIVILDDNGEAEPASFSLVDAGTFDNCELGEIQFDTGVFSCDDIGIQNYEVVVFDTNGNSSTGIASIVIFEQTPPIIDCSISATIVNTCGSVDYVEPTATDNCTVMPLIELTDGLPSGSSFPVGTTNVSFSATDGCGNVSSCSFEVTVNNDLMVEFTIEDASCTGGQGSISPNISGGSAPYVVEPSDLTNLDAGDYVVIITDSNGCVIMETVTVGQINNNLVATIATTDATCNGDSNGSVTIEIEGGSGNFDFDFGNGIDPMAIAAGIYEVVITDINDGCQLIDSFEILEPELIQVVNIDIERDACTGEIGGIELEVSGGVEPFTVTGDTLGNILILEIVDANGCTITENVEQMLITDVLTILDATIIDSDGSDNGSIDLSISGGLAPYAYSWIDSTGDVIATTEDLMDLAVGEYTVMVIDANGCVITDTYVVDLVSSTVELDKSNTKVRVYPNPSDEIINIEFLESLPQSLNVMDAQGKIIQSISNLSSNKRLDVTNYTSNCKDIFQNVSFKNKLH